VFRFVGALLLVALGVSGCGFVHAAGAAPVKPDNFVLRGTVTVPAPAGDTRPVGVACAATVPGISAGTPVRVSDPNGRALGSGTLGDGVVTRDGDRASCDFPFQIRGVPGGVPSYDVTVGDRPPQSFPAKDLRENAEAIIRLTA
jgi:hypothetical protein